MTRRAKGDGTIYKAGNGYRAGFVSPDGNRIYRRFKTYQEASDWLAEMRTDINRGEYVQDSSIPLGDWMVDYLETYKRPNVRASTLSTYYSACKTIEPIAHIPLKDLSSYSLQKFYNSLPAAMSDGSKLKVYNLLNASIRKAAALDMIKDITRNVELPKRRRRKEVEIYTLDEIKKILDFLKSSRYKRYYLFVKLAVLSGCRVGEIIALRKEHVHSGYIEIVSSAHPAGGKMVINPPKTAAGIRRITLSREFCNELYAHAGIYDLVFHNRKGELLDTAVITKAWARILKYAGVPHKHFHALRHTHATQLLANNVPLLEVSKRLGHSQPSITLDMYGHAIKGYDLTLPEKIDKIFGV